MYSEEVCIAKSALKYIQFSGKLQTRKHVNFAFFMPNYVFFFLFVFLIYMNVAYPFDPRYLMLYIGSAFHEGV